MSSEFNLSEAERCEAEGWDKVPAMLEAIRQPSFPEKTVQLTDFSGNGNGISDNRAAFESAISALHEQGGGKLVVPPGHYLINGPIVFKSNIHLEIQKDATLLFTSDPKSYLPAVKQRWEGVVCYNYSPHAPCFLALPLHSYPFGPKPYPFESFPLYPASCAPTFPL